MNIEIKHKFDSYPNKPKAILINIRKMIYTLAKEEKLGLVTESLKWGEPSYKVKKGSPIRIDWKSKFPDKCSVFFNCNTSLVETFRKEFPKSFKFLGKREIEIPLNRKFSEKNLKACLSLALRYHSIKNQPKLGT